MVDFLIIGGGAITNSIFWLFRDKKMKYGYSISSGYRYFEVPDDYEFYGTVYKEEEGKRYIAVSGVRWFTSMRDDYPPKLVLSRKYVEGEYKKFDNFDAINTEKVEDIPDCDLVIGVPVSFIDKWDYRQFDIVDARDYRKDMRFKNMKVQLLCGSGGELSAIKGERKFSRILIKRK